MDELGRREGCGEKGGRMCFIAEEGGLVGGGGESCFRYVLMRMGDWIWHCGGLDGEEVRSLEELDAQGDCDAIGYGG